MTGPFPPGTYRATPAPPAGRGEVPQLGRGRTYCVTKAFRDSDGDDHPVGETWTYLGSTFFYYDDLLNVHVRLASGEEWSIPLIWDPGHDQRTIERLRDYVDEDS